MDDYKKSLFFHWVLLVIYSGINIYTVYSLSHSWPTKGCLSWFWLILFCPFFLYYFISICYSLAKKEDFCWKRCLGIGTLILGILLAGGLLRYTQKSALRKLNRAYGPMIEKIREKMPMPCEGGYFDIPTVVTYNGRSNRMIKEDGIPVGSLWYGDGRFVLQFLGGSVDVDGSTLFYDSRIAEWQIFHNDDLQRLDAFKRSLLTLYECDDF
ncbi:MAG: hypothetical protein Q9M50_08095 [Methylococcales bacterium]|nr:hypothetical protein [Methylococcales bacterium]